MTHFAQELRDGRHLGITGLGDPDATRLVIFCHPSPGSGGFDPDPTLTSNSEVRIIAHDRPGYGSTDLVESERPPMGAWIADLDEYLRLTEANADAVSTIDFGRVSVIGWGLGAMYAAALAATYPEQFGRLALIEPTAPTKERRDTDGPVDVRLEDRDALARLHGHLGAVDRLDAMLATDDATAGMDFDKKVMADDSWLPTLNDIMAETMIVCGSDADWYAERIPGASRTTGSADPTATIVERWPEVLQFMKPRESTDGVRLSDRRGSSPLPQFQRRPD